MRPVLAELLGVTANSKRWHSKGHVPLVPLPIKAHVATGTAQLQCKQCIVADALSLTGITHTRALISCSESIQSETFWMPAVAPKDWQSALLIVMLAAAALRHGAHHN